MWKKFVKFRCFPIKLNSVRNKPNKAMLLGLSNDIKKELSIRMAHRIEDLLNLPYELSTKNELIDVKNLYIYSFNKINNFDEINSYDKAKIFNKEIKNIKEMHSGVSYNIQSSFKNVIFRDSNNIEQLNTILDNFYYNRIGIRTIIGYYNSLFEDTNYINFSCNPYSIIQNAINDLENLSYIHNYPINIEYYGKQDFTFTYIDSHLYYIVFEILKNSLQASINSNSRTPININISYGKKDLIIKISDLAGGFSRNKLKNIYSYYYSNSKIKNNLSGYGVGIPLAKVYAKFFGGDLIIIPYEGIGTDVFIYINRIHSYEQYI